MYTAASPKPAMQISAIAIFPRKFDAATHAAHVTAAGVAPTLSAHINVYINVRRAA